MDRWNSPSFVDTNIKQLEYQIEIHVLTLKHRETQYVIVNNHYHKIHKPLIHIHTFQNPLVASVHKNVYIQYSSFHIALSHFEFEDTPEKGQKDKAICKFEVHA